ncbi:uncharacterized protein [Lepeophtheirus salmonis]|uniref:uncharacterized protein n=1 Tax=Lepeophtheirus salmonis TaxID=72036 RepID=UPI003AF3FA2B
MTFYKRYCLYNQAYIDLDFQQTAELRKLTLNIVEGEGDMEIYIGDNPRFWVKKYSSAVTNGLNEIIASYSVRFVRLLFINITSKLSLKGLQWYGYVRNSSNLETCIWEDNEKKSSSMDYRVWAVDTKQDIIYFCYRSPFKRGLRCFSYNVNKKARMELPSYISALLGIQNSIVYFEDKLGQRFFSNDGVHIVFTRNKEHIDLRRINISDSSEALVWTNSDYQGDSHGISKNGKIILLWANTCLN